MEKIDSTTKLKKVPILDEKELKELAKIMYSKDRDELLEKRFWKEIYKKRGLEHK